MKPSQNKPQKPTITYSNKPIQMQTNQMPMQMNQMPMQMNQMPMQMQMNNI